MRLPIPKPKTSVSPLKTKVLCGHCGTVLASVLAVRITGAKRVYISLDDLQRFIKRAEE
jgi:hypothetical protein